jgi:hypothetical protein
MLKVGTSCEIMYFKSEGARSLPNRQAMEFELFNQLLFLEMFIVVFIAS